MRVVIDPLCPEPAAVARAAAILRAGGLVVCPTETFYALAADPRNPVAVERVFAAKGRCARRPLPILAAAETGARACVAAFPPEAAALAARFWPGPLTLVLPVVADLRGPLTAGGPTVGVRVTPHPVAAALSRALGGPIVATSANRSGQPPPVEAGDAERSIGGAADLVLDAGPCAGGTPSTVIDLTVDPPRLIRPGAVAAGAIAAVLGRPPG
jgi:L-threonylcarbamoyladenylate synthase